MSVEHEAMLTVGWMVSQDEIPDFEERHDEDWPELEELAEVASELLGKTVWQSELCEEENSWGGDTQIVGVPMYDRELPTRELMERVDKLADLAEEVYRAVMRKEPEDGPYVLSWTRVF